MTDQVYDEVRGKRAHTAAVYVFVGFLNFMGMVGGLVAYSAIVKEEENKSLANIGAANLDLTPERKFQDVLGWLLTDEPPPGQQYEFVRKIGAVLFISAPLAWGYVYTMTYFMFLEQVNTVL